MSTQRAAVLFVDDDEIDAEALFRAFAKYKIANPIVHAIDGLEALKILRGEQGTFPLARPFIILLDINMPRMNGLEFLREIRQDPALKRSIVFILTTSEREEDKLAAYNEQVAGYIVKDKAGEGFLELIQMLETYQSLVELPR